MRPYASGAVTLVSAPPAQITAPSSQPMTTASSAATASPCTPGQVSIAAISVFSASSTRTPVRASASPSDTTRVPSVSSTATPWCVAGLLGGPQHVGEHRVAGERVGVVAVRLGPGAGVEHLEAAGGGHEDVPLVAGRVQPVEAGELQVGD